MAINYVAAGSTEFLVFSVITSPNAYMGTSYMNTLIGTGGQDSVFTLLDKDVAYYTQVNYSENGAYLDMQGGTAWQIIINGGIMKQSGGTSSEIAIVGSETDYAQASFSGNAKAGNISAYSYSSILVSDDAELSNLLLSNMSFLSLSDNAKASKIWANSGASIHIGTGSNADIDDITLLRGASISSESADAKIHNFKVDIGATVNLFASNLTDGMNYNGTTFYTDSKGLHNFTITSGQLTVLSGQAINNTLVIAGIDTSQQVYIDNQGYSNGTILVAFSDAPAGSLAIETVYNGGESENTEIYSGGMQIINAGGTATGANVYSGGTQVVNSDGTATGTSVYYKGKQTVNADGTAIGTTVYYGGTLDVSGKLLKNTVIHSGGQLSFLGTGTTTINSLTTSGTVFTGGSVTVVAESGSEFCISMDAMRESSSGAYVTGFNNWRLNGANFVVDASKISAGTYVLTEGAYSTAISGASIYIRNGGTQKYITVGSALGVTIGNYTYRLLGNGSQDTLTLSVTVANVDLVSNDDVNTAPDLFGGKNYVEITEWIGDARRLGTGQTFDYVDYYRFSVSGKENLTFGALNNTDTIAVALFQKIDGVYVQVTNYIGLAHNYIWPDIVLGTGDYAIAVRPKNEATGTGTGYTLTATRQLLDDVYNDDAINTQAVLSYASTGTAIIDNQFIGYGDAIDVFKFTVDSGKFDYLQIKIDFLNMEEGASFNGFYLAIYDSLENLVSFVNLSEVLSASARQAYFTSASFGADDYTIRIWTPDMYSHNYDLEYSVSVTKSHEFSTNVTNDSLADAETLTFSDSHPVYSTSSTFATLGKGNPVDVYSFTVDSLKFVSFDIMLQSMLPYTSPDDTISLFPNAVTPALYVMILDSFGNYLHGQWIYGGTSQNQSFGFLLASGNYYLSISTYDNNLYNTAYSAGVTQYTLDTTDNNAFPGGADIFGGSDHGNTYDYVGYGDAYDVYSLSVSEDYQNIFFHLFAENAAVRLYIYKGNDVVFSGRITKEMPYFQNLILSAGDYSVVVYADDFAGASSAYNTAYMLDMSKGSTFEKDTVDTGDLYGTSLSFAGSGLNTSVASVQNEWVGKGDIDRFSFSVTTGSTASIDLNFAFQEYNRTLIVYLYSANDPNTPIFGGYVYSTKGYNALKNIVLTEGNYILEVRPFDYYALSDAYNTLYAFDLVMNQMESMPNNTFADALTFSGSFTGIVGYGNAVDFYKFTVADGAHSRR